MIAIIISGAGLALIVMATDEICRHLRRIAEALEANAKAKNLEDE